ncbi:hypothetical protein BKA81DRAFT_360202 [Phyllosticta paracitricarpa]
MAHRSAQPLTYDTDLLPINSQSDFRHPAAAVEILPTRRHFLFSTESFLFLVGRSHLYPIELRVVVVHLTLLSPARQPTDPDCWVLSHTLHTTFAPASSPSQPTTATRSLGTHHAEPVRAMHDGLDVGDGEFAALESFDKCIDRVVSLLPLHRSGDAQ